MFNDCHFFLPYLSDIAYSTFFYKGQHSRIHIRDYYIVAYTISAEHLALEKKLDSHNHCSVSTEKFEIQYDIYQKYGRSWENCTVNCIKQINSKNCST